MSCGNSSSPHLSSWYAHWNATKWSSLNLIETSRGHAKHLTSLHWKTKCYSRWESSHCEEDVHVIGVKDFLNAFTHFFNLQQSTMKTTSVSYIHVLTQRKCLDEKHSVAKLIWVLRNKGSEFIGITLTGLSFCSQPMLTTCWYIGGMNPHFGTIWILKGADVKTYK